MSEIAKLTLSLKESKTQVVEALNQHKATCDKLEAHKTQLKEAKNTVQGLNEKIAEDEKTINALKDYIAEQ